VVPKKRPKKSTIKHCHGTNRYVCEKLKPSNKAAGEKHSDGHGLYLLVKPSGKYWRFNYRFVDKQKTLALGVYTTRASGGRLVSGLRGTAEKRLRRGCLIPKKNLMIGRLA
jgi:hypothetical protein